MSLVPTASPSTKVMAPRVLTPVVGGAGRPPQHRSPSPYHTPSLGGHNAPAVVGTASSMLTNSIVNANAQLFGQLDLRGRVKRDGTARAPAVDEIQKYIDDELAMLFVQCGPQTVHRGGHARLQVFRTAAKKVLDCVPSGFAPLLDRIMQEYEKFISTIDDTDADTFVAETTSPARKKLPPATTTSKPTGGPSLPVPGVAKKAPGAGAGAAVGSGKKVPMEASIDEANPVSISENNRRRFGRRERSRVVHMFEHHFAENQKNLEATCTSRVQVAEERAEQIEQQLKSRERLLEQLKEENLKLRAQQQEDHERNLTLSQSVIDFRLLQQKGEVVAKDLELEMKKMKQAEDNKSDLLKDAVDMFRVLKINKIRFDPRCRFIVEAANKNR